MKTDWLYTTALNRHTNTERLRRSNSQSHILSIFMSSQSAAVQSAAGHVTDRSLSLRMRAGLSVVRQNI